MIVVNLLDVCLVLLFNQIATRKAYGMALAKLGRYNEHVVALDGDTKNSTFCELFKNEHPNRYVECYIAEQNMVRSKCWLSPVRFVERVWISAQTVI